MTSIITSIGSAAIFIFIAAIISNSIKFEGGANPQDPKKRKIWFWIISIVNPIVFLLLALFVFAPNSDDDQMIYDNYMSSLPIAAGIGFIVYIILGFVLSKVFKNGKIGNWFK
jgi:sulfoxide reductase heme-binding subunit YedZ